MNAIETPEDAADRLWPVIVTGRYADVVEAFRKRDKQIAIVLDDLAASWAHDAPLTSGGYVAGLQKVVMMLGGAGR